MSLATTMALALTVGPPSVGEQLELDWSAPPACPQSAEVRAEVDLNLAREDFGESLASVRVRGSIEAAEGGWVLHVQTELPAGRTQRDVRSADCRELAAAAGLIIAVSLDPLRVLQTVRPPVEDSPPEPPALEALVPEPVPVATGPEPTPEPAPEPAPRPRSDPRPSVPRAGELRLGGQGEFGSLDVARGGVWASAAVAWPHVHLALTAHYLAPRRLRSVEEHPGVGVRVQQLGAGVRGCGSGRDGRLLVAACAGAEVGAAVGHGVGLATTTTRAAPWVALTVGPELSWRPRARLGVFVAADAVANLVRPRWSVQQLGVIAQTRWIGFRVVAGPTLRL